MARADGQKSNGQATAGGFEDRPRPALRSGDRVPPSNIDAERGLLGCILLESDTLIDRCIEKHVEGASFFLAAHREIYETILGMHGRREPVDVLTVIGRLREEQRLEGVGGEGCCMPCRKGWRRRRTRGISWTACATATCGAG